MTLHQPDHPLTDDEIELYNSCSRAWGDQGFCLGSWKIPDLRNTFRKRIEQLARICGVMVEFGLEYGQYYIYATRPREKNTP